MNWSGKIMLYGKEQVRRWDSWYLQIPQDDQARIFDRLESQQPNLSSKLDPSKPLFVVGYLNAPRTYFDGPDGPNKHHLHSRMGIALTNDFETVAIVNDQAFAAIEEESSIWSGSFAAGPIIETPDGTDQRTYIFFYTSRDPAGKHGLSQEVRMAVTEDFVHFERTADIIRPNQRWYETETLDGDVSIHSFRDPFPFVYKNRAHLLISAKSNRLEPGRIGEFPGSNGVVCIYRCKEKFSLSNWEATSIAFKVGKSEAEVPSLYFDRLAGEYVVTFSSMREEDYLNRKMGELGFGVGGIHELGNFYEFRIYNLHKILAAPPDSPIQVHPSQIHLNCDSHANWLVPELGGISAGFSNATGETLITSRHSRPNLLAANRDFSSFSW
jgi:hypothetical protein